MIKKMKKYNFIINAPFINTGGGKTLLISLLNSLNSEVKPLVILDSRLQIKLKYNADYIISKKNIFSYLYTELLIFLHSTKSSKILCLHGSPTIFKNPGFVSIYFQNRLYLEKNSYSLMMKIKKYFFVGSFHFADEIIVQTHAMEIAIKKHLKNIGFDINIKQFAFLDLHDLSSENITKASLRKYDFVYVADCSPHKNHKTLIEAWIILAKSNIRPSLALTIPRFQSNKIKEIEKIAQAHKLKIYNFANLDKSEIDVLYSNSSALIYPSLIESLGLPLLEAKIHNLTILASELDFVRDVCDPEFTFNPLSALSISSAIRRYLNIPLKHTKIYKPIDFINYILINKK